MSASVRRHVAGSGLAIPNVDRAAAELLDYRDSLAEARLASGADVVDGAGGASPHRVHRRGDRVADVGEVSRLVAVSVDLERGLLDQCGDDPREGHVGALAGPVDAEVAQRHEVESSVSVLGGGELFGGELGHAVRRDGCRDRVLRRRIGEGVAVDRRGRSEDQPDAARCRLLDHAVGAEHVVVDVGAEAGAPAGAHAGTAREVKDAVHAVQRLGAAATRRGRTRSG